MPHFSGKGLPVERSLAVQRLRRAYDDSAAEMLASVASANRAATRPYASTHFTGRQFRNSSDAVAAWEDYKSPPLSNERISAVAAAESVSDDESVNPQKSNFKPFFRIPRINLRTPLLLASSRQKREIFGRDVEPPTPEFLSPPGSGFNSNCTTANASPWGSEPTTPIINMSTDPSPTASRGSSPKPPGSPKGLSDSQQFTSTLNSRLQALVEEEDDFNQEEIDVTTPTTLAVVHEDVDDLHSEKTYSGSRESRKADSHSREKDEKLASEEEVSKPSSINKETKTSPKPKDQVLVKSASQDYENMRSGRHLRFQGWRHINRPDLPLEDFTIIDDIGSGQYGDIKLVEVVKEGVKEQYALKVINRNKFRSHQQECVVMNERHVMQSLNHPFFLSLINTYKTHSRLYVLTDYIEAGDLFERIHTQLYRVPRTEPAIPIDAQKFYMANILLALEHMHVHGVIHRDIKSANLLMGSNGYIKVCDFGLSRFLTLGDKAKTLVGTYQYLAPEQCRLEPYDHSVDIWALGIVMYEMCFGSFPFDSNAPEHTKEYSQTIIHKVLNKNVLFPLQPDIGLSSKLFLKSLLTKDRKSRLGGNLNYAQVKDAAWFKKSVDWSEIENQQAKAPYIPSEVHS